MARHLARNGEAIDWKSVHRIHIQLRHADARRVAQFPAGRGDDRKLIAVALLAQYDSGYAKRPMSAIGTLRTSMSALSIS